MDIGETRKPQNGVLHHQSTLGKFALRLSTLPTGTHESLAIRILPLEYHHNLLQLFLFPYQLQILKRWTSKRAGIILFTGPTGSGKTTTLYALLENILHEKSIQTITLEDPIEKNIDSIIQVQINEKAGLTYQSGLKAALRHDPDILMVGEIRDAHTAKFAFEASLTGHLVLSTLHAKDAAGTISRLLDMGVKRSDLEQSLIAVASLQLMPIAMQKGLPRRAAIFELLDGQLLESVIRGHSPDSSSIYTFEKLKRKAFAYGFISEETYNSP